MPESGVRYVTSVGMEVHAELLTRTKMFCGCPNAFGGEPNTRVCPVCLGLPGSLPMPNRAAVEHVLRTALALNCSIAMRSVFHRKNYFYPDLPKGYQVSQYGETNPIGHAGHLDIPSEAGEKRVHIRRVHLEEDTGKLVHLPEGRSGVDFNRAGVPLMEIVTDYPPDLHCPEEAREYLQQLRLLLVYLGACDGRMEQGSLRCEPNVSVAPEGGSELGVKTELKNLGSFKAVALGISHEEQRMRDTLEAGGELMHETRGWDEQNSRSFPMRVKEREHDYRYFSDPDLPPMAFSEEEVEAIRSGLPELPMEKRRRYAGTLGLSEYDAGVLVADPAWAAFFDGAVALGGDPKQTCNWMNGDFARLLNEEGRTVTESTAKPAHIVDLVKLVESEAISGKTAKLVFEESYRTGEMPSEIVSRRGLTQISDTGAILQAVREAILENPSAVDNYRAGNENVKGFLVGQVMKKTKGMAKPELVNSILEEELAR